MRVRPSEWICNLLLPTRRSMALFAVRLSLWCRGVGTTSPLFLTTSICRVGMIGRSLRGSPYAIR